MRASRAPTTLLLLQRSPPRRPRLDHPRWRPPLLSCHGPCALRLADPRRVVQVRPGECRGLGGPEVYWTVGGGLARGDPDPEGRSKWWGNCPGGERSSAWRGGARWDGRPGPLPNRGWCCQSTPGGWTLPATSTSGRPWPAPARSFCCHWSSPSSVTTVSPPESPPHEIRPHSCLGACFRKPGGGLGVVFEILELLTAGQDQAQTFLPRGRR